MRALEITTNIGCKNKCRYCPQKKIISAYLKRSHITDMNLSMFKDYLKKVPNDKIIVFSGFSEPFLNQECSSMILYAHRCGYKISVYTTVVGMKESDIELIKDIPFLVFGVHLPYDDGQTKIEVNNTYLKIINKIVDYKINNLIFLGIQSKKIKTLPPALEELLKKSDFSVINEIMHTRAGNVQMKRKIVENPNRINGKLEFCNRLNNPTLLPNGDVVLCCMDWSLKHILGNLLEIDYMDLFKTDTFLDIVKGFVDENIDTLCRYCDFAIIKEANCTSVNEQ